MNFAACEPWHKNKQQAVRMYSATLPLKNEKE